MQQTYGNTSRDMQLRQRFASLELEMGNTRYETSLYKNGHKKPEYLDEIGVSGLPNGYIYYRDLFHWFGVRHNAVIILILDVLSSYQTSFAFQALT